MRFLPYQPAETTPFSLACGDMAVISMKHGTEGLCVPSKLHTALASGTAILGIVPRETEVAQLIARHHCGIWVDPGKPEEIAKAILRLHQDQDLLREFQCNARQCFEDQFTKEHALREYATLFQ